MAYGVSNGHMTDDVSEVLIVTSVCLARERISRKKVAALDRLHVRTNVYLVTIIIIIIIMIIIIIIMQMCCCIQRITCTFNSQEQKRLLMDLDVNMRTGSCPYAVKFYGALFREVSVSCNCCLKSSWRTLTSQWIWARFSLNFCIFCFYLELQYVQ